MLSPDGKTLAYVSTHGGARTANIWVMDLATRRTRNLTGDGRKDIPLTMNGNFRPAWSPDGQWIAFTSDRGERWIGAEQGAGAGHSHPTSLYVMRADGSGLRRLTTTAPDHRDGVPAMVLGRAVSCWSMRCRPGTPSAPAWEASALRSSAPPRRSWRSMSPAEPARSSRKGRA